jgi:hypothetical protein
VKIAPLKKKSHPKNTIPFFPTLMPRIAVHLQQQPQRLMASQLTQQADDSIATRGLEGRCEREKQRGLGFERLLQRVFEIGGQAGDEEGHAECEKERGKEWNETERKSTSH